MKNVIGILMLLAVVALIAGPASAEYMTNTTFEAGSAGTGTWALTDYGWGDEAGVDVDIASGTDWDQNGTDTQVRVRPSGGIADSQYGRIYGSSGGKSCMLDFASGENTGQYVMHWYQKYTDNSATGDYSAMQIYDDDLVSAGWGGETLRVTMSGNASGTTTVNIQDGAGSTELLSSYTNDTWYEFKMQMDYQAKTYAIKVRQAGNAAWQGNSSGDFMNKATVNSFDNIVCRASTSKLYAGYDNITSAKDYMVHTNFEKHGMGENTYSASGVSGTGDPTLEYGWGDGNEPDLASEVQWSKGTASDNQCRVVTGGYEGGAQGQCGRILGSSSNKGASLDFADGENTGTYTMTWYAKYDCVSSETGSRSSWTRVCDDANKITIQTSISYDNANISAMVAGGGWTELIGFASGDDLDNKWYEFELVLDYQTRKIISIKVKETGAADWQGTLSDKGFYDSDSSSMDKIYFFSSSNKGYAYYDDITVIPEPATMTLLLLGLPFALRRRR